MNKASIVFFNAIPIVLMIILIPLIQNDYFLSIAYAIIIIASFFMHYEKKDTFVFIFGFFAMGISELFFVSTGVETFVRNSLFGIMPLWLPIIWAYAFVAMKRVIWILGKG